MIVPAYRPNHARIILFVCGAGVFLWLRIEDQNALLAALSGISLACAVLGIYLWRYAGGKAYPSHTLLIGAALFGGICGLASALVSGILMLLKNGFHGHLFPDFPFGMISDMVSRAPAWALAGALIAFGIMAAILAAQSQHSPS